MSCGMVCDVSERIAALERQLYARKPTEGLRVRAAEKIRNEGMLTREEVAAYLDVSTKKVQRMEGKGQLLRCRNLGAVVRYAARDVLRLASAK